MQNSGRLLCRICATVLSMTWKKDNDSTSTRGSTYAKDLKYMSAPYRVPILIPDPSFASEQNYLETRQNMHLFARANQHHLRVTKPNCTWCPMRFASSQKRSLMEKGWLDDQRQHNVHREEQQDCTHPTHMGRTILRTCDTKRVSDAQAQVAVCNTKRI